MPDEPFDVVSAMATMEETVTKMSQRITFLENALLVATLKGDFDKNEDEDLCDYPEDDIIYQRKYKYLKDNDDF